MFQSRMELGDSVENYHGDSRSKIMTEKSQCRRYIHRVSNSWNIPLTLFFLCWGGSGRIE